MSPSSRLLNNDFHLLYPAIASMGPDREGEMYADRHHGCGYVS